MKNRNKYKNYLYCLLLLFPYFATISAHNNIDKIEQDFISNTPKVIVKGRVTDLNEEPMIGVSVIDLNSRGSGTVTDNEGNYSIAVEKSTVLKFSYMGYIEREISVSNRTEINVILQEDQKLLDELVVIGYGVQKKSDLTGSVGIIDMSSISKAPVANFTESLAGRVAGLQTISGDGQPGSLANIVIRGGNSITQSNSPLFVVDGIPLENINDVSLNMNDVESLTVLKDASSTAIYGSRGANGVIVITTKQSESSNKTHIQYDGYGGFNSITNRMELMEPYDFIKYQMEISESRTADLYFTEGKTLEDFRSVKGIDWQDQLFRNGFYHNHSLRVSGGTTTRFNLSLSALNQNGVVINSGYNKYQGRLNLVHNTKKVNFFIGVGYTNDDAHGEIASSPAMEMFRSFYLYRALSYRPIVGGAEDIDLENDFIDPNSATLNVNPIKDLNNSIRSNKTNIFLVNSLVDIKLIDNLNLKIRGSYTERNRREEYFYNSLTARGTTLLAGNTKGVNAGITQRNFKNFTNENTLTYTKKKNNHSFVGLLGATYNQNDQMYFGLTAEQIPYEQLLLSGLDYGTPGNQISYIGKNKMLSALGRIDYGYKERYLLTATYRADASSRFSKENRWGFFPSLALAWRVSEEDFMRDLSFISNAKLRLSYGVTGNNRIGDYSRFAQISSPTSSWYSFGDTTPIKGIDVASMENQGLKWERTSQYNAGIDFSMFNNRISIVADWYYKLTDDLLLNANLPYTTGYSRMHKNIGSVSNSGVEFTLSTLNIQNKTFSWETDFNISFNRNQIESLTDDETKLLSTIGWTGAYSTIPLYIAEVGKPVGMFYGLVWDGVYNYDDFNVVNGEYVLKSNIPTNGSIRENIQPGDIKYVDVNKDGIVNEKDNVVIGRGAPIHIGGLNNDFRYKNLSLNVFFQWSYGNDIMNANRIYLEGNVDNSLGMNQLKSYSDRWTPENTASTMYRVWGQGPKYYSTRTMEDGSYLRLKTVSLSYQFPRKLTKAIFAEQASVYVSGQNLYTWTKYSGFDPETNYRYSALTPGLDFSTYPRSRTFVFGIKLNF